METDLHPSHRLRMLLPSLTNEERQRLRENIEKDGKVRESILWWNDGKEKVIVDGMHRWDILTGTDIPYETEELHFDSYEDAEIWILNHQLGRRNLLKPDDFRKTVVALYNRLKASKGGDHTSEKAKSQNETLLGDTATQVGASAGVSRSKVHRLVAKEAALEKLTKAAKIQVEKTKTPDKDVITLSKLSEEDQNKVARAIRSGQAETIGEAIKETGAKQPPKKGPKVPPKQFDRPYWFKQWMSQIGPVCRFVDKMAKSLNESRSKDHVLTQEILRKATDAVQKWMEKK